MTVKMYLVMDIGCLECGEPSEVLYLGTNYAKANEIFQEFQDQHNNFHGLPDHEAQLFTIYVVIDQECLITEGNKATND